MATSRFGVAPHAWNRLIEISRARFPFTSAELERVWATGAALELWLSDDGASYRAAIPVLAGREDLYPVLNALAADRRDYEVEDGKRLARQASAGALSAAYCRSMCEGFGYAAFDAALAELTTEHQRQAAKQSRRRSRR